MRLESKDRGTTGGNEGEEAHCHGGGATGGRWWGPVGGVAGWRGTRCAAGES